MSFTPHLLPEIITVILVIAGLFTFSVLTIRAVIGAPYVPTPMAGVKKMVALGSIQKGQKIYDIGCGDGRILYESEKNGAVAEGFELSPLVYAIAITKKLFKKSNAKIHFRDFQNFSLHDAHVIFCYMMPHSLKKYTEKFERELRRGTKIISYAFKIGDWTPAGKIERDPSKNVAPIYLYEIGKHQAGNNTKQ